MAHALAWSHSRLESFINCPWQFHEVNVAKTVPKSPQSPEQLWGDYVHQTFEKYQDGLIDVLPDDLKIHLSYMRRIQDKPGLVNTEMKVALTTKLKSCEFFDPETWWRGIIDFCKIYFAERHAFIADYKTGKPHDKWGQLSENALWIFHTFPEIDMVMAQYYWTKDRNITTTVWKREQIKEMWGALVPNLRQYKEAFETDTWQKRPSGLCHGWCPVTTCSNWRPKRIK